MDKSLELKFTMFENGLDFILSSLEYLINAEEEAIEEKKMRNLKYSILNLSSGTELILKSRLYSEHWTYIFQDMNKANRKDLVKGKIKSVDSNTTIDRLGRLCDITFNEEEKDQLRTLRETRNKIEHYEVKENLLSVQSIVNKVLTILFNFISSNDEKLYSSDIEQFEKEKNINQLIILKLSKIQEHYKSAVKMAEVSVKNSMYNCVVCPKCTEKVLIIGEPEGESNCYLCRYKSTGEKVAWDYINSFLSINEYELATKGGEYPLYNCPNCASNSFVLDDKYICFSCGEIYDIDDISKCWDCGELYTKREDDSLNICSTCYEYRRGK